MSYSFQDNRAQDADGHFPDTAVFCSADIVALIVQAVGGASASEAVENDKDPAK